jgi:hypothetical protein
MDKIFSVLVTIIGILLVLPLITVTALQGPITNWIIAIAVLIIGLKDLIKK